MQQPSSAHTLTVTEVIRVLWSNKYWVLAITLLVTIAVAVRAFTMTPVYRAEILMSPVTENPQRTSLAALTGQLGGVASLAGVTLSGSSDRHEAVAVLESRDFTQNFISQHDLMPILFAKRWDEQRQDWIPPKDEAPTLGDAYRRFNQDIRALREDEETGLIRMTIDWKDPELAAFWANDMIERVNERLRARAIERAERSVAFLHEEAGRTSIVELKQAIYRLIETQINEIMLANVREEYAFEIIDPAVPPDADNFVKPQRALMIALGGLVGVLLGALLVLNKDVLMLHRRLR